MSFFKLISSMKGEDVMDARIILWGSYRFVLTDERVTKERSEETLSTDAHHCKPSKLVGVSISC